MEYQPKHAKKEQTIKAAGIIILVLATLVIIAGLIFVFSINTNSGQQAATEQEPMTMGVVLIDLDGTDSPTAIRAAESVAPTIKETKIVTEAVTQSVETQKPTVKPTEKPTEVPTEPATEAPSKYLMEIEKPDFSYAPEPIYLTNDKYELAAKIVMQEFGSGGYIACCIQAQALRDAVIYEDSDVEDIYHSYQYDRYYCPYEPNQDCYDAIDYIFEQGGLAVPHRILFMYNPYYATSSWHESQNFVVEYGGVRYFDAWG